jgi:hypothetical protein
MKTVQRLHKRRKQSRKERLETKQPDWKFDFQRAKEYQKKKRNQGFRSSKIALEQLFTDEKYRIMTFQKNSKISIRLKTEKNAGLSFLLK